MTISDNGLLLIFFLLVKQVFVYVIAWVGVKFGINFTSVRLRLSGNKIARGEAECYLPLNLTRVKFVPEISRLTVPLKINWRANEASETLSGVYKFELVRYIYIYYIVA